MKERRTLRLLYSYYSTTCHPTISPTHHGHSHSQVDNHHIVIQGISFESIELFVKTFELFPNESLIPNLDTLRELFRHSVTKYTWLEFDTKDWDPNEDSVLVSNNNSIFLINPA